MNKEETLALYRQGRDAWNAWAEGLLAERKAREDAEDWNEEIAEEWEEKASANFSGHTFGDAADFSRIVFPGDAEFGDATFEGNAEFGDATFEGVARFAGATFEGNAEFGGARFEGNAEFEGNAWFAGARFEGDAGFGGARFEGVARFGGATFEGNAWFAGARFEGVARFAGATFEGNAWFHLCVFESHTSYAAATFHNGAGFTALKGRSAFSLADTVFHRVPDFTQAQFDEAPRLDNLRIAPGGFRSRLSFVVKAVVKRPDRLLRHHRRLMRLVRADIAETANPLRRFYRRHIVPEPDSDLPARWRSLKRLAIQAHDHTREMEYFRGEVISRRLVEDKRRHAAFWFGLAYQAFSSFGRSVVRPLAALAAATILFAFLYLGEYGTAGNTAAATGAGDIWAWQRSAAVLGLGPVPAPIPCNAKQDSRPWRAALQLSMSRAVPLPGIGSGDKTRQIYACLYGVHSERPFRPRIPDTVALMGYGQTLVSAIFIFLLLLALRNHFRIK